MQKRKILSLILLILLSIVLTATVLALGCAGQPEKPSPAKEIIVLTYAGDMSMGSIPTESQYMFADMLSERTNGTAEVKVYPAGQLYSMKEMGEALSTGLIDMAQASTGYLTSLAPTTILIQAPMFEFESWEHEMRWLKGKDQKGLGVGGEWIDEQLNENGIKLVAQNHITGVGNVLATNPTKLMKIEDLVGLKMRMYGELQAACTNAWGAETVVIPAGETYIALQRGTVDGVFTSDGGMVSYNWTECVKYIGLFPDEYRDIIFAGGGSTYQILFNLEKWNSLPESIQQAIIDINDEILEWGRGKAEKVYADNIEIMKNSQAEAYWLPEELCEKLVELGRPAAWAYFEKKMGKEDVERFRSQLEQTK